MTSLIRIRIRRHQLPSMLRADVGVLLLAGLAGCSEAEPAGDGVDAASLDACCWDPPPRSYIAASPRDLTTGWTSRLDLTVVGDAGARDKLALEKIVVTWPELVPV